MTLKLELTSTQRAWLHSMLTIAAGGAIGALGQLFEAGVNLQTMTLELNKVDWHRVIETAIGGSVLALYNHWRTPPNVVATVPAAAAVVVSNSSTENHS